MRVGDRVVIVCRGHWSDGLEGRIVRVYPGRRGGEAQALVEFEEKANQGPLVVRARQMIMLPSLAIEDAPAFMKGAVG